MRYLTEIEITTLLNLGRAVEMFIGRSRDQIDAISWVDLRRTTELGVELSTYSVYDEGDIDHLDLYSFSSVDPDNDFETIAFPTVDNALTFIKDKYQLLDLEFVNQGMIQEQYRIFKENGIA